MALVKKLLQNRRKVTKIHTAVFLMLPAVGFFLFSGLKAAAAEKPAQTRGHANHLQSQASPEDNQRYGGNQYQAR